ncbi:MAG: FAD-dependent oxidoreductase [Pseudomonadota bacterium]
MTTNTLSIRQSDPSVTPDPEAFPKLTDRQIEAIAAVATRRRTCKDGEALWELGDKDASFYVVESGAVAIVQPRANGQPRHIVTHVAGGFTGDVDVLTNAAAVVGGIAEGETTVLEVCPQALKRLIVTDSGLSDLILSAFLARRRALIAGGLGSSMVIGSRFQPDSFRIREFLERNSRPFQWIDLETADNISELLDGFGISPDETPVVVDSVGNVYRNPSNADIAEGLGLSTVNTDKIYDIVVVGSGPAGLAASVYAASEGLDVVTLEATAPGGQASTSSKIENYLGFPTGISGRDLAQRAYVQAEKFGAHVVSERAALSLDCSGPVFAVGSGEHAVRGRSVVVATGAQYRKLPLANCERFEGRGIYYGATGMEAAMCAGEEVVVVGGGNSAGQAAVFLSGHSKRVHVCIRSDSLDRTMSRYLISRIDSIPNIEFHPHTEVTALEGDEALASVTLTNNKTGAAVENAARHVFVFIGAAPNTRWLDGCVALDQKGFVLTGPDIPAEELAAGDWTGRAPFLLETSKPRVFAVGDVRSGSTKRVASAVGEGSISVAMVHRALADA